MAERSYNGRNIFIAENGDFESADALSTKWGVGVGFAGAGTTITKGTDSTNYYKITWGTGGGYIDNESVTYVPVRPNTQYTWSVRTRTNYVSGDATNGGRVSIVEYNAARVGVTSVGNTSTPYVKTTQDWTTYTYTFTTRNATNSVRFNIRLYAQQGAGTLKMDMDVDNISLTEVLPARTTATSRLNSRYMGGSTQFNGSTSLVTVPFSTATNISGNFSLSFNVYHSSISNSMCIVGNYDGTDGISIGTDGSGKYQYGFKTAGVWKLAGTTIAPNRREWERNIVTYDGSNLRLYRNGSLIETTATTGVVGTNATSWFFGKNTSWGAGTLSGRLSEVKIYNVALNPSQVSKLYVTGDAGVAPVASYPLDEQPSTYADSIEGATGTGTATTYSTDTPVQQRVATRDMGTALRFDGVDDSVTATDTSNPFTSGGTLASWFILSTTAANQSIIGNSLNLNGFMMIYRSAGLRTEAGNGTNTVTTAGVRLVPGRAYFGVSTFDGVNIQTYINGVLADAPVARTSIGPSVRAITIAKGAGGSFDYMRGTIDESRVWNRALTATEIANMYYNNIVPRNGLVAEYLFNEGSGTTALDTSGNGNDGTITGATYTTDVPLKARTLV